MSRMMTVAGLLLIVGAFTLGLVWYSSPLASSVKAVAGAPVKTGHVSSDTSHLLGSPTVSVVFIDRVLAAYGSPARGEGAALYALGVKFGIDPVFPLAFFFHESSFGRYGAAAQTRSLGNIICTPGYLSCIGRFRAYASWESGFLDWFHLIQGEYLSRGLNTVEKIVPVYAPSVENDVSAYVAAVKSAVACWRSGQVEV